jgi:hypothetical protein
MKHFLTTLACLLMINSFAQSSIRATSQDINATQRSAEFIQAEELLQTTFTIEKAFPASRNHKLQMVYEISCDCDKEDLYSEMHNVKGLSGIEYGPEYQTLGLPNDYNLSVPYDYALNLINAEGAWAFTEGDPSIIIGITDAGYYMDNIELFPKVTSSNLNFNMSNPIHGTAVATTAAGNTNNSFGKSSIGYNSTLDLRPMNYNGLLESSYAGAQVINASWAAGCYYSNYGQEVIDEIYNNGSIVIAAAGNGTTCSGASNYVYPASYEHVISVTSIGPANNHERIYGNILSTHQHNDKVDISAPGYDVYVTTSNGTFMTANGTSFASPYVAGTVALMLSVNPCLSFEQIEHILKESADTIIYEVNPQYIGGLGAGRLDAAKALEMAMNTKTFDVVITKSINCENFTTQLFTSEFYGEAPYTIEWSNGQTGPLCIANAPDLYTVSITDSKGCKFYEEIEVAQYEEIKIESSKQDVTCYGRSNGSIQLDVTGGTPEYSYLWSTNDTTSYLNDLYAGTYTVLVTDVNNCSNIHQVTINQPNPLETTISNDNDNIDLTVTGGVQPYSYQWYSSNGNYTTEDLSNISNDFYEVLITDANGCMISDNILLHNTENTASITEFNQSKIRIYPNPSNGSFTVDNYSGDITVMDMNGKIIKEVNINGTYNFNNIPSGMYIIKNKNSITKMIVNK